MDPSSSSSSSSKKDSNRPSSCKYTGVRKRKWGKYVSEIRLPNSRERIWLGSYDTAEKAARAFDFAQFCLRGESANFNFPNNLPEIPGGHQSMTSSEIQAAAARFAQLDRHEKPEIITDEDESMIIIDSPNNISEGMMITMESEVVERSFHEELCLNSTLGSGNYVSEFGYFTGFDEYMGCDYHNVSQPDNFDYIGDEIYDASLYQDSCLWNF